MCQIARTSLRAISIAAILVPRLWPNWARLRSRIGWKLGGGGDRGEAGRGRPPPRLRQQRALEQPPAADAEQVAARVGDAVRDQDRVDAVLERASVLDQVQPEAGALALGPDLGVGQPDLEVR